MNRKSQFRCPRIFARRASLTELAVTAVALEPEPFYASIGGSRCGVTDLDSMAGRRDSMAGRRIRRRISLESAILIGGPRRRTGTSLERPLLKESAIGVVFVERIRSGADFDGTVVPRNFA